MKAVFFDLDATLLDRNASVERFISAQYNRLSDRFSHILKNNYLVNWHESLLHYCQVTDCYAAQKLGI